MSLFRPLARALALQRGNLLCWVPVCLSMGIGGYFSLTQEPGGAVWLGLAGLTPILWLALRGLGEDWRPIPAALILIVLGAGLAGFRAHWVAEPVLGFRYYGPIEGRLLRIDRSNSDAVRLTLDRVVLKRMAPDRTPSRVRISLHGQQGFIQPMPGMTVILTGYLSPPSGPVEPGGFDFQRKAWFSRIGAVGYTRTPVLTLARAQGDGLALWVYRIRTEISTWIQAHLPGEAGAFAAAVTTGDRSALSRPALEDLRASNLAHLLAISGLHMGLLTGFIFSLARFGMALIPGVALTGPTKKIAAVLALLAGAIYLMLSGGNVATERAYIMVAVMFVAVLLDRRAVTLRAVAVAATIVLLLRPEVLPEPGFQMSFAATTALVAVFGLLRRWPGMGLPKWARPVAAVAISSAVAGLATAPFAAAHFNRVADYGLLANLLSVPLMGLVVIPGAVMTACLAPLGLGWIGLTVMRPAIEWILAVAHWVAGLDGALTHVIAPPGWVIPMIAFGGLWLVLWRGAAWARGLGLGPLVIAFGLWAGAERPAVLISDTGGLVGLMGPEGRALSKPKGDGFSAQSWLENDGDGANQADAFGRAGFVGPKGAMEFQIVDQNFAHLTGRTARAQFPETCRRVNYVITSIDHDSAQGGCYLIDPSSLRETGALAVGVADGKLTILTARQVSGQRLWNSRKARKEAGLN